MNRMNVGRVLWGAGTPRTMRAHWMLRELGLPYESRPITSRSAEIATPGYLRLNPSQKIPTLVDGDFVLSESAAIVTYLGAAYGAAKDLVPPTQAGERARYDQWCSFAMMELDANTLYIIRRHEDLRAIYGEAPNAVQAARECFARQARAAAERLSAGGPFVLGNRFTGADILLTTCLAGALRRKIEIPRVLHDYVERTTAREAYRQALQANTPH
ncbi:MAG TPA: glutathione S-transferase family protein [Burkholderiales bacterium]|nr:glutathione S-transferase family protein [Burkholderiales bacterium]